MIKINVATVLILVINLNIVYDRVIYCRHCNSKITDSEEIINQKSSKSRNSIYKEVFTKNNVLTHTFKNPSNIFFELITTKSGNLVCDNKGYEAHTFFPGYSWSTCICHSCGNHHGWLFTRLEKYCGEHSIDQDQDEATCRGKFNFLGLSIENLIIENSKVDELIQI